MTVGILALIAMFWLRQWLNGLLQRWSEETGWQGFQVLRQTARIPSVIWVLTMSAWLAVVVSTLPQEWEKPVSRVLWTLFVLSLALYALNITGRLITVYGDHVKAPKQAIDATMYAGRIIIVVVTVFTLLEVWGAPLSAILVFIGALALLSIIVLRDTGPDLIATLQLSSSRQIKVGDYIKLKERGEEGYVDQMTWRNVLVRSPSGALTAIPNRRLVQSTVINYGHPIKKAKRTFHFYFRSHIQELTGLKAKNLQELADLLKTVPESVIYYHTHHFLEEYQYLTPQPPNDLALWVDEALGDEVLAERLASVDTTEFTNLQSLRERHVSIIEEYICQSATLREAAQGDEFYFVKSISVIVPTHHEANDLREFVESLRKISSGSLYFHLFESKLRLGRGLNDFSAWLAGALGEEDLAQKIARLDPYACTLEGLRTSIIQLIEKELGETRRL